MTVAITATLFGDAIPPAVLVTVTGLTGVDRVTVTREPSSLPAELVAGGENVTPSSDALVLLDLVPELGRPLVYVAETYSGSSVAVETSTAPIVVPDPGRHVLTDPLTGRSVLVDVLVSADERENAAPGTILYPIGRRRGVPLTDVRQDDTGTLPIFTRDRVETDDLVDLLEGLSVVYSRHPFDGCDQPAGEALYVPSSSRQRRSRAGDRLWSLPFTVVDVPRLDLIRSLVDLEDLDQLYAPTGTLADLAGDYATLLDIARDDLGAA